MSHLREAVAAFFAQAASDALTYVAHEPADGSLILVTTQAITVRTGE